MIDAEKILGGLLRQSLGGGRRRRRCRRKSGLASLVGPGMAGAAGLGALGVAIAAFEHYAGKKSQASPAVPPPPAGRSGRPAMPPPPPPVGPPPASSIPSAPEGPAATRHVEVSQAILLIQAMIAAANADGHIDAGEKKAILEYLEEGSLSAEEREFVQHLIASPPSIDTLIPQVTTDELAKQVYAVSELAIEVDTEAERAYLDYLKKRLGLSGDSVQ